MNKILARSHYHFQKPKGFFYVFPPLLPLLIFVVVLNAWGSTALAAPAISQSNGHQFSQQARIGFHAGDDWEPSITADRYGHVYTLYKHYDVSGQQTCPNCNLHLLLQRSGDEGLSLTSCCTPLGYARHLMLRLILCALQQTGQRLNYPWIKLAPSTPL